MAGVAATVVVPIFNAPDALRDCLASLSRTLGRDTPLLLIDDASTDPRVAELLDDFLAHADLAVTRLRHSTNLGFVATANRAFNETSGDVVLLNADTVTTTGWLARLSQAAVSRPKVATVTPWSNNAEICSLPNFCENNPRPADPDAVARTIAQTGDPSYPEIPTGVGFCLYVTRASLNALGGFDADRFGRGYGEENDYCRRAAAAGWVNLLCDDAYVVHRGGESFGPLGLAPNGDAMARLLEVHPDYERVVAEFIGRDPLAERREALAAGLAVMNVTESRPMTEPAPALAFDGERFTPECVREMWYEHWHRYAFAADFAEGKDVLDLACGEGYGSDLLSRQAKSVVGVDVSAEAVEHARQRYGGAPNLRFEPGDCANIPLPDDSVDLVVSFETLEHVEAQEAMLAEFSRVLRPSGMLMISTPDKRTYSDETGYTNEFHVRELYRPEFEALLTAHFPHLRLFGQKLLFQSALWLMDGEPGEGTRAATLDDGNLTATDRPSYDPLYYVALCSREALPEKLPAVSLFGDRKESVYEHYNQEVRRVMAAGERILELEREVESLRAQQAAASEPAPWWRRWRSRPHD